MSSINTDNEELENRSITIAINTNNELDDPEVLWSRLYQIRKQRVHLNKRLKLFIRITILFGTAVLIAGIDPLNLQWWFALIPLMLMIVNMVLIVIIRSRAGLLETEETLLLEKLRPFRIATSMSSSTLAAPPPTYNIATVEPPAYFSFIKSPSYATLAHLPSQESHRYTTLYTTTENTHDIPARPQTLAFL
ncbi:hypothetical protein K7432_002679 [Basidiobolus ranarum]|uniref:Transmembrane protein n=1 Tax=Basidiobolus ranarum TaxID=34480 RepID=A0ABR2X147_9FUNG